MLRYKILLLIIVSLGCRPKEGLDGLWYDTESLVPDNKQLFHFSNDSIFILSTDDSSDRTIGEFDIKKYPYSFYGSNLEIEGEPFNIVISRDSILLSSAKDENIILLKRLEKGTTLNPLKTNIKGSFLIQGKDYTDSISIINNTTLLFTGESNKNYPTALWEIINYDGMLFFNIRDTFFPLTIIESISNDSIVLTIPTRDKSILILKPIESSIDKSQLFGVWEEIGELESKPPLPLWLKNNNDAFLRLEFSEDSLEYMHLSHDEKIKWDLTSDGKRIYFVDKLYQQDNSYKIIQLTEDTLTIYLNSYSSFLDNTIRLKKKNGR